MHANTYEYIQHTHNMYIYVYASIYVSIPGVNQNDYLLNYLLLRTTTATTFCVTSANGLCHTFQDINSHTYIHMHRYIYVKTPCMYVNFTWSHLIALVFATNLLLL